MKVLRYMLPTLIIGFVACAPQASAKWNPKEMMHDAKESAKYMETKNYSDIKNPKARSAVENFCNKGCNRWTCKFHSSIKNACKTVCPENDVKHCIG